MPKISVIVPVYNVENYLTQCLDSILKQTFSDFECICINDGSIDNSLKILKEYAFKDNRIKVINQENKGVVFTRNIGLKFSTGDYITFVDSDDWIDKEYLNVLYSKIISQDFDIVRASFEFYDNDNNSYKAPKIDKRLLVKKQPDIYNRLFFAYTTTFIWGELYKTSIIKNNNVLFYQSKMGEDIPFKLLTYIYSKKILFIENNLYFYRKRQNSLTQETELLFIEDFKNFIFFIHDLYNRKLNNKESITFCINLLYYKLGQVQKRVDDTKKEDLLIKSVDIFKFLKMKYKIGILNRIKVSFALLVLTKFEKKSFKIFRIVKNFNFKFN